MRRARGYAAVTYWALVVFVAAWAGAWAQGNAGLSTDVGTPRKLAPRDQTEPKEQKKVRINHADRARYDSARKMFYLYRDKTGSKGPIEFQDDKMKLTCDEAAYNETDDTAACAGNLKIVDEDSVITGAHIYVDFDAEIARIEGSVKIVTTEKVKPKEGEGGKEETRVTTLFCDLVEYTYTEGKRRAIATGNLKGTQEDKTVFSPKADYDLEKEIVVLSPPVRIQLDNGSEFTTDGATISTADDWMETGNITGFFIRDKEEDKGGEEGKPEEAPASEPPAAPEGGNQ
ncbi:MAG: LptA/OstA family protein [Acidobacteriota bacterium]|nr:LptA/OstA family protein [Acidobacteriota bacterium]